MFLVLCVRTYSSEIRCCDVYVILTVAICKTGEIEAKALTDKKWPMKRKASIQESVVCVQYKDVIRIWDRFYIDTSTILRLL